MAELVFSLDTSVLQKRLKKVEFCATQPQFQRVWRRFMTIQTGIAKREIVKKIAQEGPIGVTRAYRTRIGKTVRGTGFDTIGKVQHDNVPHAIIVEEGRSPNRTPPPHKELLPWIRGAAAAREIRASIDIGDPDALKSMAIVLAKSIGRKGTFQPGQKSLNGQPGPGMKHFERTFFEQRPKIVARAFRTLIQSVKDCIERGRISNQRGN